MINNNSKQATNIVSHKLTAEELQKNIDSTNEQFFRSLKKAEQKKIGQFMTPLKVANYMAERLLSTADLSKNNNVTILDPGAGTGVLGTAVIKKVFEKFPNMDTKIIFYENDPIALKILRSNLTLLKHWTIDNHLPFTYSIKAKNFILDDDPLLSSTDSFEKNYDLIIANPPYMKIKKDSLEADKMSFVVHGAPNIYGLFWAKATIELKPNATSAFIIPRSWMSGAYFQKLRQFMIKQGSISELHAFNDRNNIFGHNKILQELVIVIFKKSENKDISIWSHENIENLKSSTPLVIPRHLAIIGPEKRIYLIKNEKELAIAQWAKSLPSTFIKSGLRMKTGLTVCFRNRNLLENKSTAQNVPIFFADNFKNHSIVLKQKNGQYLSKKRAGFLQDNIDYIFVKRFSSKEEPRRIQTAFYNAKHLADEQQISTDNKINFVVSDSSELLRGAFLILSSTRFDNYYRLLSGTTQVNSTEINSMNFPNRVDLVALGKKYSAEQLEKMNQSDIDNILSNFLGE